MNLFIAQLGMTNVQKQRLVSILQIPRYKLQDTNNFQ